MQLHVTSVVFYDILRSVIGSFMRKYILLLKALQIYEKYRTINKKSRITFCVSILRIFQK